MSIKDYILTPKDIVQLIRTTSRRSYTGTAITLVLLVLLTIILSFEGAVFLTFAFILFWWRIDPRISFWCALICLILIVVFYIIKHMIKDPFFWPESIPERIAVWAYYFLVIGVIKQIIEYKWEQKTGHYEKE